MNNMTLPVSGFAATGLSPALVTILTNAGLTIPTPIQEQAIPVALRGVDVIGLAQTGTGKTLAFSLPLLERLQSTGGRALILAPTRELALQIDEVIRQVARKLKPPVPTAVLIGGTSMHAQIASMHRNPRIIIATPGRLEDHLRLKTVTLGAVNTVILDEADRMLDMGFIAPIKRIVGTTSPHRQTLLFSATMSPEVTKFAAEYMQAPTTIEIARPGTAAERVEQQVCYVASERKPEVLNALLEKHQGPTLVFSRTRHGAAKLSRKLSSAGYEAAEIHSDRSLSQRRQALEGFKSGRYRVLVATDIASRGIDVQDIELVVNYDLPDAPEDYVHRIGRTGRAGKAGLAISLAGHDQYRDVQTIERLMKVSLPLSEHSDECLKPEPQPARASSGSRGGQRQGRRGPQGGRSGQSTQSRSSSGWGSGRR